MERELKEIRTLIETYKEHPIFLLEYFNGKRKVSEYYGIGVKGGNIKHQRDRYEYIAYNIGSAREIVDEIENGRVYLTEWEYTIWVRRPNKEYDYSFTKERLLSIWRAYPKANERRKVGYLKRLHDANFHTEAYAIEDGDFNAFNECLKESFG